MMRQNKIDFNKRAQLTFIILLVGCAVCQFILTQYFTIFEGQEHMGLDASWEYLKVIVANRENNWYSSQILHPTTQPEAERIPLVLLFYKLTEDIWLAFGIANITVTLLSIYVLWQIIRNLEFSYIQGLIIINLFLCPYLANGFNVANDLGYYSCVLGETPHMNIVVLGFLLLVWLSTKKELTKSTWTVFVCTIICTGYICLCKGLGYLVWCGVPILFFLAIRIFIKNDIKIILEWKNLMLLGVLFSMFVGRVCGGVLGFTYLDTGMNWITAANFFKNIGGIFLGYMLLVGGIPASGISRNPASFLGLVYVFGIIIFLVGLISFLYCLGNSIKGIINDDKIDTTKLFLEIIIVINTMEYMFLDTLYGADTFEVRYLLIAVLAGFILIGYYIKSLDDGLLYKKFGVTILFFSIVGMDLYSDYFLAITDNSSWNVDLVKSVIDSTDAGLVVFWDNEKEFIHTERVIRVIDADRVYKCISGGNTLEDFGDYAYYDDSTEYEGPTVLIVNEDDSIVSPYLLENYKELDTIGNMRILYCKYNPIDIMGSISSTISESKYTID